MENKELTFGEKMVGKSFNPSGSALVENVKIGFAEAIDSIKALQDNTDDGEIKAMYTLAIRRSQEACMWAVKAITW